MSQEDVEVVESAIRALAANGLDAFLDCWTDDPEHRAVEGAVDDVGPMYGRSALRAYVQDWFDMFDDFETEALELIAAGEARVVAVLRVTGRAKLSGVETDMSYAVVYTLRDGKIRSGREYGTKAEALEAVGLSG